MGIDLSFAFVILLFQLKFVVCEECCNCDSPNVKTVLFNKMDMQRDCWEHNDVALLLARRLMQELVPRKVPVNIPLMKEYFELAENIAGRIATSNVSRTMLHTAFADTVGGYLYAYGVPLAKEAYYEGKTDYKQMKLIHNLGTRLKASLGTDGKGWRTPASVGKFAGKVTPLKIDKIPDGQDPCEPLIMNDLVSQHHPSQVTPRPKDRKVRQTNLEYCPQRISMFRREGPPSDELQIPLPFLDDDESPRAVAVPFRNRSLYSLTSPLSIEILSRYYTASISCLKANAVAAMEPPQSKYCRKVFRCRRTQKVLHDATEKFEIYFYRWINDKIIPHLDDATWYVGFGSVLRITETIKKKGFQNLNRSDAFPSLFLSKIEEGSSIFPVNSGSFRSARERLHQNRNKSRAMEMFSQHPAILTQFSEHPGAAFYLCTIILIILSFWLLSCTFFVFYKVCRRRVSKRETGVHGSAESDLSRHFLNSDDTDVDDLISEEEEPLLGSSISRDSPGNLSGFDSLLSDLNDQHLSDDDIVVSSAGISCVLSDESGVTTGKLSSMKTGNEDVHTRKTETRKERLNKRGFV